MYLCISQRLAWWFLSSVGLSKISWKGVADFVYRRRRQSNPDIFAKITPALANKLSIENVAKFPTEKRRQITICVTAEF